MALGKSMKKSIRAAISIFLVSAAVNPLPSLAQGIPKPSYSCKPDSVDLCARGLWLLPKQQAVLIARLKNPATYRICNGEGSLAPVLIRADGREILAGSTAAGIYPNFLRPSCALVTAKHIVVQTLFFDGPKVAYGSYQRLEKPNPFTSMDGFVLSRRNDPPRQTIYQSALLAAGNVEKLYRVCFVVAGPIEPIPEPPEADRRILTDGTLLSEYPSEHRTAKFGKNTCVDIEAKDIQVMGAESNSEQVFEGQLVY